jgi:hypothetical protein
MSSDDQVTRADATDWVQFELSVQETIDLSTLTWTVTFDTSTASPATGTPQAAPVVAGSGSQTVVRGVPLSKVTVQVLVGSGPGGFPLAKGRWFPNAHTTSGPRIIVVPCTPLLVE